MSEKTSGRPRRSGSFWVWIAEMIDRARGTKKIVYGSYVPISATPAQRVPINTAFSVTAYFSPKPANGGTVNVYAYTGDVTDPSTHKNTLLGKAVNEPYSVPWNSDTNEYTFTLSATAASNGIRLGIYGDNELDVIEIGFFDFV